MGRPSVVSLDQNRPKAELKITANTAIMAITSTATHPPAAMAVASALAPSMIALITASRTL